mgnify:CR=1 FL=1
MTIGVTGAFGFLGASCVAELLANPLATEQHLVAFGSSRFNSPLFDRSAVEVRPLNILDTSSLDVAIAGIDMLIHFAGKVGFAARDKRSVWDANVLGALHVFRAAQKAGVRMIINIASVSALGPAPELLTQESPIPCLAKPSADCQPNYHFWHHNGRWYRPLTEQDRPYDDSGSPWSFKNQDEALAAVRMSLAGDYSFLNRVSCIYLDSKLTNLELVHQLYRDEGLPVVNILPGTAIGRGEAHTGIVDLIRALASGRLKSVLPGACSFMDSRDFAGGVKKALLLGKPGEDYILAGAPENNLSFSQLANLVLERCESRKSAHSGKILELPCFPARIAGYLAERILPSLALSEGTVLSGCVKAPCSSEKAIRELGYAPFSLIRCAIAEILK